MPDKSSREIERDLEQERAQLRDTIDEVLDRMTLEGAWDRAGKYMRENHEEFGQTLGRVVKEKPIAVGLVAIGMAWIMFGSSSAARQRSREESFRRPDTQGHAETRARLAAGDFDDASAQGPTGPDARPDPWAAPTRTPASASGSAQAKSETGTGSLGGTSSPARSTPTVPGGAASTVPGGAASSSTGSLSGSSDTRGSTPKPTTTTLGTDALGSSSSSGGTTSIGSTPGSGTKGAGDTSTASRTATTDPKSPKT